jgi:hypothetical protein
VIDPWRYVDADDESAADFLAGTVELALELGAHLHPQLRFVVRDGQCSVHSADATQGEPLIVLPAQAFLRVGRIRWTDSTEALEVDGLERELSDAETELLFLQTAFHNSCGKLPWLAATHPVLAPDLADGVVAAVRAFRPSFRHRQPSTASLFWSNRAFRLPPFGSSVPEPMALPLVDLLDHRRGGATGTWTGDAFAVPASHASASGECALDYGLQRDAIGMAVVYGFADESADVAHSAPVEVEVAGLGRVRVAARGRTSAAELLAPVAVADGSGWLVSHLAFRPGGAGDLARDLHSGSGWPAGQCEEVVAAVANANTALADGLIEACRREPSSAAATLGRAALRQRLVLSDSAG